MDSIVGRLRGLHEQLVRRWAFRVLNDPEVPQARRLPEFILLNHMPMLLDRLIDGLEHLSDSAEEQAKRLRLEEFTIEHVKARIGYNYSMPQILKEYSHLRVILIEEIYPLEVESDVVLYIHTALDYSLRQVAMEMHKREMELEEKLIAIVSHDMKNPLSAVMFNLQAAIKEKTSPESRTLMLARSMHATRRCLSLAEDLLDFNQLRAGNEMLLRLKHCNLGDIVRMIVDESCHHGRSITVENIGENLDGHWDCDRMAQVVSNLLSNAVKHSLSSGSIRIRLTGFEEEVEFLISNDGKLPLHGNIFEAYRRDGGNPGVGLGLYIARHVVLAHGGTISATSNDGQVTFRVRLPRS